MEHPERIVRVEGETAHAYLSQGFHPRPSEFRTVKDADDADREKVDPGDNHICAICKETFFWKAFKTHVPMCIRDHHAGRLHIFGAERSAGIAPTVKMTPGDRTGYPGG